MSLLNSTLEEARAACALANSYTRLGTLLEYHDRLEPDDWFRLLGEQWDTCDNIWRATGKLRSLLRANRGRLALMMTPEDCEELRKMPDRLTVYRGCSRENWDGLCWTLDPAQARGFPSLNRYRPRSGLPALFLTGEVSRDQVAFNNRRGEREVIAYYVAVHSCDPSEPAVRIARRQVAYRVPRRGTFKHP